MIQCEVLIHKALVGRNISSAKAESELIPKSSLQLCPWVSEGSSELCQRPRWIGWRAARGLKHKPVECVLCKRTAR